MGIKAPKLVENTGILLEGVLASYEASFLQNYIILGSMRDLPLEPRWYWIHLSGPWQERNIVLHLDYGDGFWEADRVALERMTAHAAGVSGALLIPVAAKSIRIGWQGKQAMEPVIIGVYKASLARVCYYLLMREFRVCPVRALSNVAAVLLRRGRRGLGDWLYGRYSGTGSEPLEAYVECGDSTHGYPAATIDVNAAVKQPLFSILVPTYNTHISFLQACLQSVLFQIFTDWELCIADDCSTHRQVNETIYAYARQDARIKFVLRQLNGHISVATNTAMSLARGTYIVLLDHDDELHPMALAELAAVIASQPELDLIFTDEDKIDIKGRRSTPFLKTSYNAELHRGQNCVSHVAAYRRTVVQQLGGFREGYEGSQDWDLALRVADHVGVHRIGHLPKILYHWRKTATSTAVSARSKPYALDSGRRAVEDSLSRKGIQDALVKPLLRLPGSQRVVFAIPEPEMLVSLIVATSNQRSDSFRQHCWNAAGNGPIRLEFLENDSPRIEGVVAVSEGREIIAKNAAAFRAKGEVLMFLDANVEGISADWLREMIAQAARKDVGAVGGKLYRKEGRISNGGYVVDRESSIYVLYHNMPNQHLGHANRARLAQNLSAIPSCCMAVRRSVFELLKGFDESLPDPYCSVDFCLRANAAGLPTIWTPFAEFIDHSEGQFHRLAHSVANGAEVSTRICWDREADRLVVEDTTAKRRWQQAPPKISKEELQSI